MHIAIEGCAHGELETIYKCITELEAENNIKIELLICCGDFQSVRNENDLRCMAVPPKYYNMCSFYKYYSGQLVAPVLTIFIGGNHEASNYLQELPFGGWVAPNIYYLGYAGVVNFNGLRIGGISGIYKGRDYSRGHYESSPYGEDTKRSVYHIRNVEVFRLKQLCEGIDIFLSHDWPTEITKFGNEGQLLKFKPYFKDDIDRGNLGSPPCKDLLFAIKPKYWFAAHLHCKFAALVPHDCGASTKFLALDKCVPRKRFLQVIEMAANENTTNLQYDLEWLTILQLTPHLFSTKQTTQYMPSKTSKDRWEFTPTAEEKSKVLELFANNLAIPHNFEAVAPCYEPGNTAQSNIYQPDLQVNAQTTEFCGKLGIADPTEELVQHMRDLNESNAGLDLTAKTNASHSFIDDSELEQSTENVSQQVGFKRKSLVLPDAVNKLEEDCEIDADKKFESERNVPVADQSELKESESETNIIETNESDNVIETVEKEEEEETVEDTTPVVKKFKRRNASIYEQTETD